MAAAVMFNSRGASSGAQAALPWNSDMLGDGSVGHDLPRCARDRGAGLVGACFCSLGQRRGVPPEPGRRLSSRAVPVLRHPSRPRRKRLRASTSRSPPALSSSMLPGLCCAGPPTAPAAGPCRGQRARPLHKPLGVRRARRLRRSRPLNDVRGRPTGLTFAVPAPPTQGRFQCRLRSGRPAGPGGRAGGGVDGARSHARLGHKRRQPPQARGVRAEVVDASR